MTPANAAALRAGTTNLCEEFTGQDLFPRQEYDTVNATFTQDVTDWLTFFADGFYSKRDFSRESAAASLNRQPVPTTNAFFVAPPGAILPLCPASAGAPAGTRCLTVDYSFINDLPLNTAIGSARSWQVTPGVRIKLPHDWQFEGIFGYARNKDTADQFRGVNAGAVAAALRSSDPATALDVFGLGRTSAAALAAISNFISFSPTLNRFNGYEARLNGTLFSLPAGDVKLAIGYERQEQEVDLGSARGPVGTPLVFRSFSRKVDSGYAQLVVPVVGSANAMPGIERLDLDAAIRYEKYSDVGSTTNPKFGVNYSPFRGLAFRGNYGTSFRAPLISQIYGNSNNLFVQSYQDPAAGGATVQGVALSGQNLALAPEESTSWSVGADWEPVRNARLSLTYFDVDYKNQVKAFLSDLTILGQEAQFAGTGIILRGPRREQGFASSWRRGSPRAAGEPSLAGAAAPFHCSSTDATSTWVARSPAASTSRECTGWKPTVPARSPSTPREPTLPSINWRSRPPQLCATAATSSSSRSSSRLAARSPGTSILCASRSRPPMSAATPTTS